MSEKTFTDEEIEFLKENYARTENKKLAEIMGKNYQSIRWQASKLKLKKDKSKIFTDEQIEFILNNYQTMRTKDIADKLNVSTRQISSFVDYRKIKKGDLIKRSNAFTPEQYDFIKDNYTKMKTSDIAKHLNIEYKTLKSHIDNRREKGEEFDRHFQLNKNVVKNAITIMQNINHNPTKRNSLFKEAFEMINTEEKAYWLGFLYADGCVSSKSNQISLSLTSKDYEHCLDFSNFMGLNREPKIRTTICGFKSCENKKYEVCTIGFSNKKIKQNLIDVGCEPVKTYTIKFPTLDMVPKNLIRHFIRGFFDGDGHIHIAQQHNKDRPVFGFTCAVDEMLESIKEIIQHECDLFDVAIIKDKRSEARSVMWSGRNAMLKFYCYLYKDSSIFLKRKKEKFDQVINNIASET